MVCNGNVSCDKELADLQKAPTITITINKKLLTFEPNEYLFFDSNNKLDCRFGDISDVRMTDQICPDGTLLAFGIGFMEKYLPVLTYNLNGTATLSLLNEFQYKDSNIKIFIWIIGFLLIMAFAIGLFCWLFKQKQMEISNLN